ncbi:unnamed protein product, partial [Discosporangium mesarthrocarpum]
LAGVLGLFGTLNVVVAGLWGYLEWVDPASEGGVHFPCKIGQDTRRYCSLCRKSVKGFDHHCSWLNTCISSRNYVHFYLLAVAGSLLYGFMVVVGVL